MKGNTLEPPVVTDPRTVLDPLLVQILDRVVEGIAREPGIRAAWHFGSVSRGMCDRLSDVDLVMRALPDPYGEAEAVVQRLFAPACDRILLCWPQDYNGPALLNFGLLLESRGRMFQFDAFFLAEGELENPWCRHHFRGCGAPSLLADKDGTMAARLEEPRDVDPSRQDTLAARVPRMGLTWHFHLHMAIKYFLRRDLLKLEGVRRKMYQEHLSLMMVPFPDTGWGSDEARLSYFGQEEAKKVLEDYVLGTDLQDMMVRLDRAGRDFAARLARHWPAGKDGPDPAWALVREEFRGVARA